MTPPNRTASGGLIEKSSRCLSGIAPTKSNTGTLMRPAQRSGMSSRPSPSLSRLGRERAASTSSTTADRAASFRRCGNPVTVRSVARTTWLTQGRGLGSAPTAATFGKRMPMLTNEEARAIGWLAVILAFILGVGMTVNLSQSSWAVVQRLAGA